MGMHFFAPILVPFFTEKASLSMAQILLLQSIFQLSIFIFEVPTGAVADRIGRKWSIMLGCMTTATGALIYTGTSSFLLFSLAEIVWGMGMTLISGAKEAFIYDALKEMGKEGKAREWYGRAATARILGLISASIPGSLMAKYLGINAPLIAFAIASFAASAISFTLHEPREFMKRKGTGYWKIMAKAFGLFRSRKGLLLSAIDFAIIGSLIYYSTWLWQPLAMERGMDMGIFGIITTLYLIAEMLVLLSFPLFDRLLGEKNTAMFMAMAAGAGFLIAAIPSRASVIAFTLLSISMGLARKDYMTGFITRHSSAETRTTVMSMASMAKRFLTTILNPLVGLVFGMSKTTTLVSIGILLVLLPPILTRNLEL